MKKTVTLRNKEYSGILTSVIKVLEQARYASARSVNAIMTATYWEIGRRIMEFEQKGERRAKYGEELLKKLSVGLTKRFGRGFSIRNLRSFRAFYLAWPIRQTLSAELESKGSIRLPKLPTRYRSHSPEFKIGQTSSAQLDLSRIAQHFPLPWSHYVRLLSVSDPEAREFYEAEALRGGWSVRQLDRQIASLFYERTLLSRKKAAMLKKGGIPKPEDIVTPDEEIKDPCILEFLNLKDEYSESELEDALTQQLEKFLLELGGDFAFLGRQRRLRIGNEWYRIDLLFFHRRLRCLVVIDLKVGKFTHADAGQMHLYLNYAREHWTNEHENPPVGLILCAEKDSAVAHYALEGLPNRVMAAEYRMKLPDEKTLVAELKRSRRLLEKRILPRKN